ncbi:MAG TPA: helix-turn-helix domain-containing protein [Solirubrobacterales bacterium]|nr:helix-turn-helix domain-containing protein [Solirubrobacterales bacterium]
MTDRVTQVRRARPGRHALPREFIAQHQRARIIAALAEETVDKGYRSVTVADIVRRAGIARNTFYENFSSKEDCFLAASEFAVKEALRRVVDAASKVDTWPARVNVGLAAFLGYVASEPALARTCVVEALSAGPAAVDRYEHSIQAFVPLFRMGRKVSPQGEELPETLEETIVGGLFWILYQRIVMGQVEQIEELLPELVEFSLTPYIGAEAAKRASAEAPSATAAS